MYDIYARMNTRCLCWLWRSKADRLGHEYENWYKLYFNPGGIRHQAENFKVWITSPLPQYKIIISKGRYLDQISLLRLTLRRFIQPERVRQDIKDVLRLDYVALPDK